jgi:hypothetical protein
MCNLCCVDCDCVHFGVRDALLVPKPLVELNLTLHACALACCPSTCDLAAQRTDERATYADNGGPNRRNALIHAFHASLSDARHRASNGSVDDSV